MSAQIIRITPKTTTHRINQNTSMSVIIGHKLNIIIADVAKSTLLNSLRDRSEKPQYQNLFLMQPTFTMNSVHSYLSSRLFDGHKFSNLTTVICLSLCISFFEMRSIFFFRLPPIHREAILLDSLFLGVDVEPMGKTSTVVYFQSLVVFLPLQVCVNFHTPGFFGITFGRIVFDVFFYQPFDRNTCFTAGNGGVSVNSDIVDPIVQVLNDNHGDFRLIGLVHVIAFRIYKYV